MCSVMSVHLSIILSRMGPHVNITHDALDLTVQGLSGFCIRHGTPQWPPCPLNNRHGNLPGHHTWDSPQAPALPPASDIWDHHWRPFQICSFGDPQSDIWWWPLKHIWFGSGQCTSSCNAFLFARKFANGSCKIVFICSTIIHGS